MGRSHRPRRKAPHQNNDNPNFKKRECLRCGKLFGSTSVGNRICAKCYTKNNALDNYTGPRLTGIRIEEPDDTTD